MVLALDRSSLLLPKKDSLMHSSRTVIAIALLLFSWPLAGETQKPEDYRLGEDVVPTYQVIDLDIDPSRSGYTGRIRATINVRNPVTTFRMHSEEIDIDRITLSGPKGSVIPVVHRHLPRALLAMTTEKPLPVGSYTLTIDFSNEFDKRAVGLYRTSREGRGYVFTQLEAVDARKAFPCWDEPNFKIPFQLIATVPPQVDVIFNTSIESQTVSKAGKRIVFRKSKPLPTYLLAIAAGEFEYVPIPGMSTPGRIVTVKGQSHLAQIAAQSTPRILTAMETWFGQKYPFEKLDIIAVPEFWPGAMENPGAITFADSILLLDSQAATTSQRRTLARIMAHELAHMWFGDMVTMKWWDDLWLNETFADWMGDKISAQVFPAFRIDLSELQSVQGIMEQDARPLTDPIRNPYPVPENVLNSVGLAYNKGKAVLTMFERWIGDESFRRGVQQYLKAHAWGNATSSDLWRALSRTSRADMTTAMGSFTEQSGLPLIEVAVLENGSVRLTQKRFVNHGVPRGSNLWHVPVSVKYSDGQEVRKKTFLLNTASKTVKLGETRPVWVNPNADAVGYYRWALPIRSMDDLARNRLRLNVRERIAYPGNLSALLDAGVITGEDFLRQLAFFSNDADPQVIAAVISALGKVQLALVTDEGSDSFAAYVRKTLGPAAKRFGMEKRAKEDSTITLFRPTLITWLADVGRDPQVIRFAKEKAEAYLKDPSSVDPQISTTVLKIAAHDGDRALFDEYRKRFETSKTPGERSRYLAALSGFNDRQLSEEALRYAINGPLRPNEIFSIPLGMGGSQAGRDLRFRWFTQNYPAISSRIPPIFMSNLPFIAAGCETDRIIAAKTFFKDPRHRVEGTLEELAKVEEQVNDCVKLRSREQEKVARFLNTSK